MYVCGPTPYVATIHSTEQPLGFLTPLLSHLLTRKTPFVTQGAIPECHIRRHPTCLPSADQDRALPVGSVQGALWGVALSYSLSTRSALGELGSSSE